MAKRIISKFDIERLKSEGHGSLRLEPGDTLTPLARDTALELGIKIEDSRPAAGPAPQAPAAGVDADKLEAIVHTVLERLGSAQPQACAPCATPKVYGTSPNKIKHVKMPLDRDMPPTELHDAQGVLRNPPEIGFRLLDVVTMDDSASIAGGFMSFHPGAGIKWTLNYDEIEYVVEGLVEISYDDGKKITATTGDTIFIPKGTSLHWNTPTWVKIFYATFPSNWADQV
ncbi:MAG TPA: cupin domain-containing protein [Spirochaetia bacterium]|nr:cupin domain-containing protein [Spirochaetia bacterium]